MTEDSDSKAINTKAAAAPGKKGGTKSFLLKWGSIVVLALLVSCLLYRWAGTTRYRGTVQRVYEKQADYRIEFVDADGNVHVAANREIRFPYFKLNTADLHAELNRYAQTQDVVDFRIWGFRFAWASMFPNVIDVEFVRSNADTKRLRAENAADAVIEALRGAGVLKGGEGVRAAVVDAILQGWQRPLTPTQEAREDTAKAK